MDIGDLPPAQRAERYRELAAEQLALAANALPPGIKSKHLELAALWVRLAEEAERRTQAVRAERGDRPVDTERRAEA